tara:strand:- start:495 stop:1073 length:579 start_codon:yes stop_codon:yes gene_type:complete
MKKFKEGDEIVRVSNAQPRVPLCYKAKVLLSYEYIDLHNGLSQIHDEFWELAEDTSKPVYTQEMYDNDELPAVGMFFNIGDGINYESRIDDFKNTEVKVIAVSDLNERKVITFYHLTMGLGCGFFLKSWVHPTPAPIELTNGKAYTFDESGYQKNDCVGLYEKSRHKFHLTNYTVFVNDCTSIRPMTVAESK